MNVLGIIPARGGSKGISKKNIVLLDNKPLIEYTIESCKKSKRLSRFIVSTDSEEIAGISTNLGAEVPFIRPKEFSEDNSSSLSVVKHSANFLIEREGLKFDAYMLLQPTTPFRTSDLIDRSINMLEQTKERTSIISIVDVGANHPYRMYKLNKSKKIEPLIPGKFDPMLARQKLPKVFIRSGDIYLTTYSTIFEENSLIGSFPIGIEVGKDNAINIDSSIDLKIADQIMKAKK